MAQGIEQQTPEAPPQRAGPTDFTDPLIRQEVRRAFVWLGMASLIALVLGAQLVMGVLFGILGLILADPMVAMIKIWLEREALRNDASEAG